MLEYLNQGEKLLYMFIFSLFFRCTRLFLSMCLHFLFAMKSLNYGKNVEKSVVIQLRNVRMQPRTRIQSSHLYLR